MKKIEHLVIKARTYRRFFQERVIDKDTLLYLVNCARQTASARNIQPLKFGVVSSASLCSEVFETLSWAGYLDKWSPIDGERPASYIVVFNDENIASASLWDQGIMSQTIVLAAAELEIGACIIASVKREELAKILKTPPHLSIALVIALGYPKEDVRIVDMVDNQYKYYRDEDQVHYVPKRTLKEVVVEIE